VREDQEVFPEEAVMSQDVRSDSEALGDDRSEQDDAVGVAPADESRRAPPPFFRVERVAPSVLSAPSPVQIQALDLLKLRERDSGELREFAAAISG
jgi:hypothetical protein